MKLKSLLLLQSLIVLHAGSMLDTQAEDRIEEPSLLRRPPGQATGAIQCCPQGTRDSRRCLERLVRLPTGSTARATCASMFAGSSGLFSVLSGASNPCDFSNTLGIRTSEYRGQGWWQDGPPTDPDFGMLRDYPSATVAMGSPRCEHYAVDQADPPGWQAARERCRLTGYKGVHIYIESFPMTRGGEIDTLAPLDPYQSDSIGRYRVQVMRAESPARLSHQIAEMLMRCEVVDFAFFDGHGTHNQIGFQDGSRISIGQMLSSTIAPCALSPNAQMQFSGCNVACSPSSEEVRQNIEAALSDPRLTPPGNPHPFQRARFLFNTAAGTATTGEGELDWIEKNVINRRVITVRSTNDTGLEYFFRNDRIVTDIPSEAIPACN